MAFDDDKTVISGDGGESPGELSPGAIFGQYKIIRLLGRGGMGEVYHVRHQVLNRDYALKLIHQEVLGSGDALERFRREAEVMGRLEHPNIVRVDDFGETAPAREASAGRSQARYWLRMELVGTRHRSSSYDGSPSAGADTDLEPADVISETGSSLADYIKSKNGKLPESEVRSILEQVLSGLAYAHEKGLVHRDLKPANILLSRHEGSEEPDTLNSNLIAKIADFGLVKVAGEEWLRSKVEKSVALSMSMGSQKTEILGGSGQAGTSTKALLGTYAYMSPEQKRGEEADAGSDIYAVGLMAYQMLTGEESLGMDRPSELADGINPAWDEWVRKGTRPNRQDRFAHAREMLSALSFEDLTTKESKATTGEDIPKKASIIDAKETKRGGGFWKLALTLGVIALIGWGWWQVSHESPRPVGPDPQSQTPPATPTMTQTSLQGPVRGEDYSVDLGDSVELDLIWIAPGEFVMGEGNSTTQVRLSRGYWMGKYPVTVGEYRAFAEASGYRTGAERNPTRGVIIFEGGSWGDGPNLSWRNVFADNDRNPVVGVSWNDAMEFARWLTERERSAGRLPEGYEYTLPSEAQWEYAARAGTTTRWSFGDDESLLGDHAWFSGNSGNQTRPVGQKRANPWGLHDVHGNVWEWTRSWHGSYPGGSVTDYEGPGSGTILVLRGGSWRNPAANSRSAYRNLNTPGYRLCNLGFRLALSSVP